MEYAHLVMNMREANFLFKYFIGKLKDSVVKTKKTPFFYIKLLSGDEHYFMNFDTYEKWNIGRTYIRDGKLYHSGFPVCGKRGSR